MIEQLALISLEPVVTLTERQQAVMDALQRAGHDGLDADQVGALLCAAKGIHGPDDRCVFDGRSGLQVLRSLEAKGLAVYNRANRPRHIPGAWLAVGTDPIRSHLHPAMLRDDEPIPF